VTNSNALNAPRTTTAFAITTALLRDACFSG
jgi:hypothetical protein